MHFFILFIFIFLPFPNLPLYSLFLFLILSHFSPAAPPSLSASPLHVPGINPSMPPLKASTAYKHCAPCTGSATQGRVRSNAAELDADSDQLWWSYWRTGSSSSTTTRTWGKEMEARLKGISSGEGISPIEAPHQVVHPIHAEVPAFRPPYCDAQF